MAEEIDWPMGGDKGNEGEVAIWKGMTPRGWGKNNWEGGIGGMFEDSQQIEWMAIWHLFLIIHKWTYYSTHFPIHLFPNIGAIQLSHFPAGMSIWTILPSFLDDPPKSSIKSAKSNRPAGRRKLTRRRGYLGGQMEGIGKWPAEERIWKNWMNELSGLGFGGIIPPFWIPPF